MLANYLKIALRSLLKFRGYAAINLLGLALGLTAGILIMLYVLDELSFDTFHSKLDRIYRVESQLMSSRETSITSSMEMNGWAIGNVLRKDYPEVEAVMYSRNGSFLLVNHEGKRIRERIHFSSPEFFQIFSFPLVKGNAEKALNDPYSIVITEDMEKKYFSGQRRAESNPCAGRHDAVCGNRCDEEPSVEFAYTVGYADFVCNVHYRNSTRL
jgi:putative ABC transport system permease protein